ncbi:MAG TPA: hypothetical protein DEO86_10350 [Colwellia sp.]|nr:hypothetical protein [Colwellia sp.]
MDNDNTFVLHVVIIVISSWVVKLVKDIFLYLLQLLEDSCVRKTESSCSWGIPSCLTLLHSLVVIDISKTIKQAITILKCLYLLLYYSAVAFFSSFSMMKRMIFNAAA